MGGSSFMAQAMPQRPSGVSSYKSATKADGVARGFELYFSPVDAGVRAV